MLDYPGGRGESTCTPALVRRVTPLFPFTHVPGGCRILDISLRGGFAPSVERKSGGAPLRSPRDWEVAFLFPVP